MNVNVPPSAIPNTAQPMEWPEGALTRIPYWIYQSPEIYALEQQRLFEGPVWNFLCLEAEVQKPGDYRVTFVGSMPVIVARDFDDEIYAFENRCAHRGALIALDSGGHARDFTCVYHAWNYDLKGNLKAVAFEDGVNGKGGMDKTFCRADHGPRKLRIANFCGLVFGSLSDDVPPIEEYLGDEVAASIKRVLHKPVDGDRPLHPDAAEQLEALFRERQGHLSRLPAAHVLHDVPHQPAVAARRHGGEPERRQPRELLLHRQGQQGERLRRDGHPLGHRGLRAEGPEPARQRRRVRRRLPHADPHGVSEPRAAADPERAGGAAGAAEGPDADRAELDHVRLCRRHAGDEDAAAPPEQSRRPRGLCLDGRRRGRRLRAARRRRGRRRARRGRDGRLGHHGRGHPRHRSLGARLLEVLSRA